MIAMDFAELRGRAQRVTPPLHWSYIQATADPAAHAERDVAAWQHYDLVPAVLRGAGLPEMAVTVPESAHRGGAVLRSPLMISPTAAHGLVHPQGESATARAAAGSGVLMIYSNSATVEVTEFGRSAGGPWWAQLYLQRDRGRSWDYLDRARAAGAGAVVLTVDIAPAADAAFRRDVQARLTSIPGNFPDLTWAEMSASFASGLTTDDVAEVASRSGLPVHVKGVLNAADAERVVASGAAGVIVSNHGRRQLGGVVPTADALPPIASAVGDRAFVSVDGGIRSGSDVVKALALGARMVGVGRPIVWALAADGSAGVSGVLDTMNAETARAVAAMGLTTPGQLGPEMVRPAAPPGVER
jgi:4-hydroxymandelate oxidase